MECEFGKMQFCKTQKEAGHRPTGKPSQCPARGQTGKPYLLVSHNLSKNTSANDLPTNFNKAQKYLFGQANTLQFFVISHENTAVCKSRVRPTNTVPLSQLLGRGLNYFRAAQFLESCR